jgi:hypothetical protein
MAPVRIRRGLLFWGLFFVALGAVPLLIRAGVVDETIVSQAWRLWPLALIAVGVAILVGRSRAALATTVILALVLGALAGAALAAGDDWLGVATGCSGRDEEPSSTFDADGVIPAGAVVDLRFSCGRMDVATAIGDAWTLTARYDGDEPDVDVDDEGIDISTPDGGPFGGNRRHTWDLELPTEVPFSLDAEINGASGSFDLIGTQLTAFDLQTNAGDVTVALSGADVDRLDIQTNAGRIGLLLGDADLRGALEVNAGAIEVCVPDGAGLHFDTADSVALGNNFDERGLTQAGDVWTRQAEGGAGTIELEIDGNAASVTLDPQGGCR